MMLMQQGPVSAPSAPRGPREASLAGDPKVLGGPPHVGTAGTGGPGGGRAQGPRAESEARRALAGLPRGRRGRQGVTRGGP